MPAVLVFLVFQRVSFIPVNIVCLELLHSCIVPVIIITCYHYEWSYLR